MSTPLSICSVAHIPKPQSRPVAKYHPDVWGNQFLNYTPEDEVVRACKEEQVEDLKKEARRKLMAAAAAAASCPSPLLNVIDALQRLGVAYHFEGEIEEALQHIYGSFLDNNDIDGDLYNIALRFRLLRQQGYSISCEIFNKFKDEQGGFKEALITDVRGMLGLYEVAYLQVHGEDILEEALAFTIAHLASMVEHLEYPLAQQVTHALNRPIRRGVERLEARRYMSIYENEPLHDTTLLKLAKLDFNLVQSLHKEELSNIARWWKELDFGTKLPFARNRLVECFFWINGVYFEPQYALARRILTKVIVMTSIMDDIYDAYGTLEELELLTKAIDRWDISSVDHLPDYMKPFYAALLDVYKEIEKDMEKEGYQYRHHYAKEAMKTQAKGYFEEAKWFHEGLIPTMEEYMNLALVTSAYNMLAITSLVGMGEIVTKEAFEWVISNPKIIKASTIICRLKDDISSHKFEQKRRHIASSVECYMKQYGVSEKEVYENFLQQVEDAWKDINEELLQPTAVPTPLLTRVLNLSRVIDVIYTGEDGYTHVGQEMKNNVASVLIHPMV